MKNADFCRSAQRLHGTDFGDLENSEVPRSKSRHVATLTVLSACASYRKEVTQSALKELPLFRREAFFQVFRELSINTLKSKL